MSSLQEQLLKAGLTTKQKTRQANTDKRRQSKQQRSGVQQEATLQQQVQQELLQTRAEKQAKDIALNAEKKKQLLAKEQSIRIQQIIEHHQLKGVNGEVEFNYTFDNKIKKLLVDSVTHRALVKGQLALCALGTSVSIVTAETAEKIATIDASVVLLKNDKVIEEHIDEDDPYAQYQIPDDLMW